MTKAVIIAGGKGERLRPLTYEMAKCLIPIHRRALLDHVIDLFWKYQTYEIWFSLGYLQNQVREKYPSNPFWIDIHSQKGHIVPLGSGGWLNRLAKTPEAQKLFTEEFYACNSDNLFDLDLTAMMKAHKKSGCLVTVACTKVEDVSAYGSVHITNDKVTNFEEKIHSRIKKPGWVNGGYYIFSPKIFSFIEEMDFGFDDFVSLEKDVFPVLAKKGLLGAYKSDGQWFDTGTFDRWSHVLKEWQGIR